jgi:hypothetical protein
MSEQSAYDDEDYYFDDGVDDAYDVHPTRARAGGGGVNRPFHTGRGTRITEARAAFSSPSSGKNNGTKKSTSPPSPLSQGKKKK